MQTDERQRERRSRRRTSVAAHSIPSGPSNGPTLIPSVFSSSTNLDSTRTPDQLARDRALELQRLRRAIRPPPPGAMDIIRESTERSTVVEQYARFRERMDNELQQTDLGEPPSQAIECGISNTRLPPGPSVEDVSQWRTRELHELAVMQREVAEERRPQNFYHI